MEWEARKIPSLNGELNSGGLKTPSPSGEFGNPPTTKGGFPRAHLTLGHKRGAEKALSLKPRGSSKK